MNKRLKREAKAAAIHAGADLAGVVSVEDLPEHGESIRRILSSARSVVVLAARHSASAIRSANIQVAQFDTIHTYGEVERAAHATARFLESHGYPSAGVPAFIPLDMRDPKKGMVGEICWRRAAVRSGIGSYGENGLVVTREFGAAVRISGVVTAAGLETDPPLEGDACDHCMRCVEACPARALRGGGKIDKKLCGDRIFQYGFRFFRRFMEDLVMKPPTEARDLLSGEGLREIWQTLMTGNYYYCFACQSQCPSDRLPGRGR
jgi:epoxyqueuosine reductase